MKNYRKKEMFSLSDISTYNQLEARYNLIVLSIIDQYSTQ